MAGLPVVRQQPVTACGVVFVTLEGLTGFADLTLRAAGAHRFGRALLFLALSIFSERLQRQGDGVHLRVHRLTDAAHLLHRFTRQPLPLTTREFR